MGKRKSKASKQKQAKAKAATQKRKQHAKFNIPLSSDGTAPPQPNKKATSTTTSSRINNNPSGNPTSKMLMGARPSHSVTNTSLEKREEDKDFEEEYKSLQERKQYEYLQKTKPKKKHIEMAPAIFEVNKKLSTEQLLDNATSHLQDMQELGKSRRLNSAGMEANANSNLLQVLAAQKRHEDFLAQQKASSSQKENEGDLGGNSFWALRDDDSDDEMEQKNNVNTFNFAAPSFVVPSQSVSVQGSNAAGGDGFQAVDGEDDPDL